MTESNSTPEPDQPRYTQDMPTQHGAILRFMHENGSITTGQAAYTLGCLCLHKRIAELKADRWPITSGTVPFTNRYGHKGTMAIHHLSGERR